MVGWLTPTIDESQDLVRALKKVDVADGLFMVYMACRQVSGCILAHPRAVREARDLLLGPQDDELSLERVRRRLLFMEPYTRGVATQARPPLNASSMCDASSLVIPWGAWLVVIATERTHPLSSLGCSPRWAYFEGKCTLSVVNLGSIPDDGDGEFVEFEALAAVLLAATFLESAPRSVLRKLAEDLTGHRVKVQLTCEAGVTWPVVLAKGIGSWLKGEFHTEVTSADASRVDAQLHEWTHDVGDMAIETAHSRADIWQWEPA